MPRLVYENKLSPILNLKQFQKVEVKRKNAKNPIVKEEERIIEILKQLKSENKISEELYNSLKPVGSQPPRLYGLAKVHKTGCPMRPVVSMPGSPYEKIAKQVAKWLALVPECNINSSTKEMCDDLGNHRLVNNECLVSFDIVSLYTNVPVLESIDVCSDLLFKDRFLDIDKETFKILARLASCNVIFNCHDGFYKQIDGLAMGSAPAPHLANGWLSSYDKTIKGNSSLYTRYMDDIVCISKINEVDSKLAEINNIHPSLSFTVEREKEGQLTFLDMTLYNNNGQLSSGWYRKPTDTGLTLNFHSLAPLRYKKSVVIGFVHRIYRSCSTWQLFHQGLEEAKQILVNNQYPLDFIENIFNLTLNKILTVQQNNENENDAESEESNTINESSLDHDTYMCMQILEKDKFNFFVNYRGKVTEKFAQSLYKLHAPCKVIMTLRKTKKLISSLKVPVPNMLQSNVVYEITCSQCKLSYVGQTSRHLQQRFKEHIGSSGLLKKHFQDCDVSPSFEMVKILGKAKFEKLLTLEALFISEIKPALNTKDEFKSRNLLLKF